MKPDSRKMDFFDRHVSEMIMNKYNIPELEALRFFIGSETYRMLLDKDTGVYVFSPNILFDMWECEKISGSPRNSQYIRGEW